MSSIGSSRSVAVEEASRHGPGDVTADYNRERCAIGAIANSHFERVASPTFQAFNRVNRP